MLFGNSVPFGKPTRNHQIFCQSNQRAVWKVFFSKVLDGIGRRLTGLYLDLVIASSFLNRGETWSLLIEFGTMLLLLFTCNYVVSVWRGFLFLWVLGMGCVILLRHSLSLPYNFFYRGIYVIRDGFDFGVFCKLQ